MEKLSSQNLRPMQLINFESPNKIESNYKSMQTDKYKNKEEEEQKDRLNIFLEIIT